MIKNTDGIYQQILTKLYPDNKNEVDEIVEKTLERIIKREDLQIQEVSDKKWYESGYILDDPYFIANFKAIFPLVKFMFFDKDMRTTIIKFNIKPIEINNIMREKVGSLIDEFLREFNAQGEEFYKKMTIQNIQIDKRFKTFNTKGIMRGVLSEIYSNMKIVMKKKMARKKTYIYAEQNIPIESNFK